MFERNLIFCFSGSGNSLFVSGIIANKLHNTDIVLLDRKPAVNSSAGYDTVGFVFPCHAGGLPIGLADSVRKLSVSSSAYTYAVCTFAYSSGNCFRELNSIVPLNFWQGISHRCACNWLFSDKVMFPPFLSIDKINMRASRIAKCISECVAERLSLTKGFPLRLISKIEHCAWTYVAKSISSTLNASDDCNKCSVCIDVCPRGNISKDSDDSIIFGSNCSQCLRCVQYCPHNAIEIGGKKRDQYSNPYIDYETFKNSIIHID